MSKRERMDPKLKKLCEKAESEGRKPMIHRDHEAPVTRRQFLAAGLAGSGHMLFVPSMASIVGALVSKNARAENCAPPALDPNRVPLLIIDCAGGPGTSGNIVVKGQNGGMLSSYNRLGVPDGGGFSVVNSGMGTDFWSHSTLGTALQTGLATETRARTRIGVLCFANADDTTANVINMAHYVNQFTGGGSLFKGGIAAARGGFQDEMSGGNSRAISPVGDYKPAVIQSLEGIQDAVGIGALNFASQPFRGLSIAQQGSLTGKINALSSLQMQGLFRTATRGQELKQMIQCGLQDLVSWTRDDSFVGRVNPSLDADAQALYGVNFNTSTSAENFVEASMIMALAEGFSSTAVKVLGGMDYHDGSRATGDARDAVIGNTIRRALEYFRRKGKPLMIHVIADGSTFSPLGSTAWQGDAGSANVSLLIALGRTAAPSSRLSGGGYQLGWFNGSVESQGASRDSYIGADPQRATVAAFYSYAQFAKGDVGVNIAKSIVGRSMFDEGLIPQHLIFGQMT